jgi:hypothetical protein
MLAKGEYKQTSAFGLGGTDKQTKQRMGWKRRKEVKQDHNRWEMAVDKEDVPRLEV